jgi:hypothetical protein
MFQAFRRNGGEARARGFFRFNIEVDRDRCPDNRDARQKSNTGRAYMTPRLQDNLFYSTFAKWPAA